MLTALQIQSVLDTAVAAGKQTLGFFGDKNLDIKTKSDDTPVTQADLAAHAIIDKRLHQDFSQWPRLSEEGACPDFCQRQAWQQYWLIDPLDGTKEFISGSGEYTVNIALIKNGKPDFGVIYWPPGEELYWGGKSYGSYRRCGLDAKPERLPLPSVGQNQQLLRLYLSKSHGLDKLTPLLACLEREYKNVQQLRAGSSLKSCRIAAGLADLYPRFGPTSEWDTAAAQAILNGVGGDICNWQGRSLRYNQQDSVLNPEFYAFADPSIDWPALLTISAAP